MKKDLKIGDIEKWQGIRNGDTGTIDSGYLYFIKEIDYDQKGEIIGWTSTGIKIEGVSNRSQAIKKYNKNPENPNNYKSPTTRIAGGLMKPPRRGRCCWESP